MAYFNSKCNRNYYLLLIVQHALQIIDDCSLEIADSLLIESSQFVSYGLRYLIKVMLATSYLLLQLQSVYQNHLICNYRSQSFTH
jgi:hypothetical protein